LLVVESPSIVSPVTNTVPRSIANALSLLCLLALTAVAGLAQDARAHGASHAHAGAAAAAPRPAASDATRRSAQGASDRVEQRLVIAHATAPAHCPDDPFGTCCCGRAVLPHPIPPIAGASAAALLVAWGVDRYRALAGDCAPRVAFFLFAAPPRAPPASPVAV